MEAAIAAATKGRHPSEVVKLVLDNKFAEQKVHGLDDYTELRILSLNGIGLTSLSSLPDLPKLEKVCKQSVAGDHSMSTY